MKVVDALSEPESVTVIVWAPLELAGTVKLADHVPLVATVWVVIVTVPLLPKVTLLVATVLPEV